MLLIKVLVKARQVSIVLAQAERTEAEAVTVQTVYTRKPALTSYQSLISMKVWQSMRGHRAAAATLQMEALAVVSFGFQQPAP